MILLMILLDTRSFRKTWQWFMAAAEEQNRINKQLKHIQRGGTL